MCARLVGDRIADAGNLGEPVFGDEYIEWDGKSCQAVSGPR
ncbi:MULTISPECIES: hypothetical protein [unclassified Bradyrhizobium]